MATKTYTWPDSASWPTTSPFVYPTGDVLTSDLEISFAGVAAQNVWLSAGVIGVQGWDGVHNDDHCNLDWGIFNGSLVPTSADQYLEWTYQGSTGDITGTQITVQLRVDNVGAFSGDYYFIFRPQTGFWDFGREGTIFTDLLSGTTTFTAGDVFRCEISGSTLSLKKNGTLLGSAVDPDAISSPLLNGNFLFHVLPGILTTGFTKFGTITINPVAAVGNGGVITTDAAGTPVSFPFTTFVDCSGNPLSNGTVEVRLNKDCKSPLGQVSAEQAVVLKLDSAGTLNTNPAGFWPNSVLTPNDSVYNFKAYSSAGQPVLGPKTLTITGDIMQVSTITLTSDRVKTLFSNPVTLVVAPGVNKVLNFVSAIYDYKFGTTAYLNPGGSTHVNIYINIPQGESVDSGILSNKITAASSQIALSVAAGVNGDLRSNLANKEFILATDLADFTTGDGTLTVTVYYTVVNLT